MEKEIIKQKIKEVLYTIYDGVDSLVDNKEGLIAEINSKRETINILSERIKDMKDISDSLIKIKNEVSIYTIEANKLDENKSSLVKEIKELEKKISDKNEEMKNIINIAKNEYDSFINKTKEEKEFLIGERNRLDKEKKRLDIKDQELKIVENRFVRLFEGKNSAFKITK